MYSGGPGRHIGQPEQRVTGKPGRFRMWDLEKLKGLAGEGKVSRRDFIQFALATGVTVAAAETMFVEAVRAAPKPGGSFKMALGHGATTDSLDPATYPDQFTGTVGWGSIANSLTVVDYKGDIQLDLAESVEHSDDAKQWIFKLRKGVTFHNGKTVTSTDVVESFRWHMGKDSKSAAKSLLQDVTDIKADGPETTVFTLKSGSADFPYIASDYHIPIMPAKDGGGVDWQSGIRTGPYVLEKFEPGVRATMKRNPNYYGKTYFDDVEILSIIDVNARTNALTNGEVHYIDRCDLKTLSLLKRKPGNDDPIAPGIKYAIDPTPKFTYDPEKAKFHLKKAGLSNLKVDLSAADTAFAGAVDTAVLCQQHAKAAGIGINVVREPNEGYWNNVWMKKPW